MIRHKCSGYYAICQNKRINGMQFEMKEDNEIHYYCLCCIIFGLKQKYFDEKDILSNAPFIKSIYDKISSMTEDEAMEYLCGLKISPLESIIGMVYHESP
jgi:hypothetical protein